MLFKAVQNLLNNSMLNVSIRKRIWEVLEKGSAHDKTSLYTDIFLISLILLNIVAVLLETVDSIYNQYRTQFLIFERLSTFIFLVEYILRVWVSLVSILQIFQNYPFEMYLKN